MSGYFEKTLYWFYQYLPSFVAGLTFLPCGLVYGYEIVSFVLERNQRYAVLDYGPMILGACCAFMLAFGMVFMKYFKGRYFFWHFEILIVAAGFNVIASAFYFGNNFDLVGAFLSFLGHALTFIASLSYLHVICGKASRAILISQCFCWYLLGIASAVSLIGTAYHKSKTEADGDNNTDGIYVNFAAVYLTTSITVIGILVSIKILDYFGNVDYKTSMDNEFRIADSNGSIFEKREQILKRIQFFYVTRNRQWIVSVILLFLDGIDFSIFIYFIFWFSINSAVSLTDENHIASMFWIIFLGSAVALISLIFFSVKTNFVASKIIQIILVFLSMMIFGSIGSKVPFWLLLFFFGMTFSNIKISIIETSHFMFTELLIFVSYFMKLLGTSIVFYYFVSNSNNSYFYSTDKSTLMAQGFVFMIITALLTIIISLQVPRTHKTSLFDIQYGLLGVIFKEHQIEQLNVHWLNDGTIPTISRTTNQY